ncbi:sacsin N-terminal ATP-binding-like domain-containing protein [Nannocystis bainbridge]|uniref:Transglutaminase domain-containing protein n=1 Tax=Nannocystis bainbridge TaxID=2995303 RepID=A0ABT5DXH6_9BACT|nr:transglutaminase domain-containing protein [Nannocystis bainbridge]MDC0718260.1 transglutaminase domain-containing protein [Nannocystis bainbridge]
MTGAPPGSEFRARARAEADRYGPDPWVFVRELLQNARDAGATKVEFTAEARGGRWVLRCRDDGEGMTFAHARRYLFALYASSKESRRDQVGRFGVGFWSVLRFEPERIAIRSRARRPDPNSPDPEDRSGAWALELDGDLSTARKTTPPSLPGTEIELERAAVDEALERRVFDAALQNARFLATRDDPERPLTVTVNGRKVNKPFALPAPSASFRRGRVRGVVGLGEAARVELFSRGLRVRSAASLSDFVVAGGRSTDNSRVQFTELPGRLAPQALLESDALELMLSRSDARDNKALRRLVDLAQRELEGLIARQLDAIRPLPLWQRPWAALRGLVRRSLAVRMFLAALLGAALAGGAAWALWGDRVWARFRPAPGMSYGTGPIEHGETASANLPARYSDLAARYRGPQVDVLTGAGAREPPLTFRPADLRLHFAALLFTRLGDAAEARAPAPGGDYVFTTCLEGQVCPEVELRLGAPAGPMRLPVPTGHRVVDGSAALSDADHPEGAPVVLQRGADDDALLMLAAPSDGTLRYRTAPAPAGRPIRPVSSGLLPADVRREARALRGRAIAARVSALTRLTRELVAYSTAPEVAAQHRALAGEHFITRALEIGQGDCDVQNGLLTALLQEAGVESRLAIGFVGQNGRVNPWLHAWAEYRGQDGEWAVADASTGIALGTPAGPVEPGEIDAAWETVGATDETAGEPAGAASDGPAEMAVGAGSSEHVERVMSPPRALAPWGLAIGAAALFAVALLGLLRERTRRRVALDATGDLSRLLQGALQQPEVFQAVPAVFERPLVPTAAGGALSLAQAKRLAARGRLYRTRRRTPLAVDALAGDAAVLDEERAEARAVADALGATDLDLWDALLASAQETELLRAVSARLTAAGEPWQALASPSLGSEELRSLDLAPLRLRKSPLRGRRVVVVGAHNPWLQDAAGALASRPAAAVFAALDYLLDRLDLGPERTARLLRAAARDAVHEAARGRPA